MKEKEMTIVVKVKFAYDENKQSESEAMETAKHLAVQPNFQTVENGVALMDVDMDSEADCKGAWISVQERLPEKESFGDSSMLVAVRSNSPTVFIAYYNHKAGRWETDFTYHTGHGAPDTENIREWMPIPVV